ncbi:hypothetical protein G6F43_012316 [Rhizopus delemar]|nr:hypothetical protein G6F43_012316 [Rhizopus delemar]
MEMLFTSPYVASSNGLVERFMKALRQMILLYSRQEEIKTTWDVDLRLIRFVYNNMHHTAIRSSPFELVHGRKARTPLFVTTDEDQINWPSKYRDADTPQLYFAKDLQKRLEKAFEIVYEEINTYEDPENFHRFQQNDQIMLFNMQLSSLNKPRKLAYDWFGPYTVKSELSKTRFDIEHVASKKTLKNIHVSLMKPYYESNLLL